MITKLSKDISETRQILFGKGAVAEAIDLYFRSQKQMLPPGEIIDVDFIQGEDSAIVLAIKDEISGQNHSMAIPTPVAAASFIAYCKAKHIPLPHHAKKWLEGTEDGVFLCLSMAETMDKMFQE